MPADGEAARVVAGRLVLEDRLVPGRLHIEDGRIVRMELDDAERGGPYVMPGFVDIHVHGWGGHDAMGPDGALDGMARALLRRGVTSFLPTAATAPLADLTAFAERVRTWLADAPADGAEPLGFNFEGPFLSHEKRGMHDPRLLLQPAAIDRAVLEPLIDGLRVITIAPEIPGALELIGWLRQRGVAVSAGHSHATIEAARAGYAAGAATTTHLFNAMTGIDHHAPGLAVAALTDDDVYVELIADGHHVHQSIWPIITRTKPADRLLLVSDAIAFAGTDTRRGRIGWMEVEIEGDRCHEAGTDKLAGSVIALDSAVRNLCRAGVPLPLVSAAATRNPLTLLGLDDRGRLAPEQRADLVELDDDFAVRRVMRAGEWRAGSAAGGVAD
jgi:N-acetylglucosamine-6-phosphate deacetylase